jgi:NCS2 family nucleobase:cation symporter-2
VACGLIPKVGAVVAAMPISVLGGGVIVMFGMVVSAGINMLSGVNWNRRNMIILAMSLSVGLGIQAVPKSMQHLPDSFEMLMVSGLLPAAAISVILNLLIPKDID